MPSHQQKLEEVRQAVIRAVPEIVELKEGCVVLVGNAKWPHTIYGEEDGVYSAYLNKPFPDEELKANAFYDCEFEKGAIGLEILGAPIQLADVLRAMEDPSIVIEAATGQFGSITPEGVYIGGHPIWNLSKPLEDQLEEVVSFIHKILTS